MGCSTKILGGFSGAAALIGFAVFILGIVLMTSKLPTTSCGDGAMKTTIDSSDSDAIDSALVMMAWPTLIGGLLLLVGGGLGAFGGFKANKCGICSAGILLSIAAVFTVIGAMATLFFAAIF